MRVSNLLVVHGYWADALIFFRCSITCSLLNNYTKPGQWLAVGALWLISWLMPVSLAGAQPVALAVPRGETVVAALPAAQLLVFTVKSASNNRATLLARAFDPRTGQPTGVQRLDSLPLGPWRIAAGKGTVALSFGAAVASGLGSGSAALSPGAQYRVRASPDGTRLLAYAYQHDQPTLLLRALVFDNKLTLLHRATLPVDDGCVSHGAWVTNAGEVLLLNTDAEGGIRLFQCNLANGARHLLEVPGGGSARLQPQVALVADEAWVLNALGNDTGINALMISRFDLATHAALQVLSVPVAWSGPLTQLADARVNARREASFTLTDNRLLANNFSYRTTDVLDPARWQPRRAAVEPGQSVTLQYDTLGVLLDRQTTPATARQPAADWYASQPITVQQPTTAHPARRLERRDGRYWLVTF